MRMIDGVRKGIKEEEEGDRFNYKNFINAYIHCYTITQVSSFFIV